MFYAKDKREGAYNCIKERVYYDKPFFTEMKDEQGRYYADVLPVDWWTEVKPVLNLSKERLGYPTQKPEALLERIIKASSNPGDIVMDPMCGGGTTLFVAKQLDRKYIGIDIEQNAIDISKKRLNDL